MADSGESIRWKRWVALAALVAFFRCIDPPGGIASTNRDPFVGTRPQASVPQLGPPGAYDLTPGVDSGLNPNAAAEVDRMEENDRAYWGAQAGAGERMQKEMENLDAQGTNF